MAGFPNWEKQLLRSMGAPATNENLRFLSAWQRSEGGNAAYNPLNTTQHYPGAGAYNSVGVRNYPSAQAGLQATAHTLSDPRYQQIVGLLRSGRSGASQLAQALGRSPWGTDASLVLRVLGSGGSVPSASTPGSTVPSAAAPATGPSSSNLRIALGQNLIAASQALSEHRQPSYFNTFGLLKALGSSPVPSSNGNGVTGPSGGPQPSGGPGVSRFDGKPVAGWIAPILRQARAAGWTGSVSSGYRSRAEQARIYASGVRPAAKPGTSNHEFTAFPGGAIDVTNAAQLNAILRRLGITTLQWAGGKDPVHFSHPHGGSY